MASTPDLEVTMEFLGSTVPHVPVFFTKETRTSFYYPHDLLGCYCVFFSADDRIAFPGETIVGWISFLEPDAQRGKLYAGLSFAFRAGRPVICTGTVVRIMNPQLLNEIHDREVL